MHTISMVLWILAIVSVINVATSMWNVAYAGEAEAQLCLSIDKHAKKYAADLRDNTAYGSNPDEYRKPLDFFEKLASPRINPDSTSKDIENRARSVAMCYVGACMGGGKATGCELFYEPINGLEKYLGYSWKYNCP